MPTPDACTFGWIGACVLVAVLFTVRDWLGYLRDRARRELARMEAVARQRPVDYFDCPKCDTPVGPPRWTPAGGPYPEHLAYPPCECGYVSRVYPDDHAEAGEPVREVSEARAPESPSAPISSYLPGGTGSYAPGPRCVTSDPDAFW